MVSVFLLQLQLMSVLAFLSKLQLRSVSNVNLREKKPALLNSLLVLKQESQKNRPNRTAFLHGWNNTP